MERINLNVPVDLRRRLRRIAERDRKPESVVARELLVEALEQRERTTFYRRVAETQTAEASDRDLVVLGAFEAFDGQSR